MDLTKVKTKGDKRERGKVLHPIVMEMLSSTVQPQPEMSEPSPKEQDGIWDTYGGDMLQKIGAGASDLAANTFGVMDKGTKGLNTISGGVIDRSGAFEQASDYFRDKASDLRTRSDRYNGNNYADMWKEGDYSGALGDILLQGSESLPMSIGAAVAGPVSGLVGIGTLMANQKYDELSKSHPEMHEGLKIVNALGSGAAEGFFEVAGGQLTKGWAKTLYKTMGKEAAEKAINTGVMGGLKKHFAKYGMAYEMPAEGLEEVATQITENVMDKATGVDPSRDLFDGTQDAFVYGMGGGSYFTAASVPGAAYNGIGKIASRRDLRDAKADFTDKFSANPEMQGLMDAINAATVKERNAFVKELGNSTNYTEEQKESVANLINAGNAYAEFRTPEALQADKASKRDMQVQTAMMQVDNQLTPLVAKNGMIQEVMIGDDIVHIIEGDVATTTNGLGELFFDAQNSSDALYYTDADGKRQVVSELHITGVNRVMPYTDLRAQYEADLRLQLDMQEQAAVQQYQAEEQQELSNGDDVVYVDPDTQKQVKGTVIDLMANSEEIYLNTPDGEKAVPKALVSKSTIQSAKVDQPKEQQNDSNTANETGESAVISPGKDDNMSETAPNPLEQLTATLPKSKDGKIDYKAMTPQQQYEYTSLSDSPEVAAQDLADDIAGAETELTTLAEKLTKAKGADRLSLREEMKARKVELDALKAFRAEVVPVQRVDSNGNPIDETGNYTVESIDDIESLTDKDFQEPFRSVQLPDVPDNVSSAIGSGSKPIIIKKNIFEKNRNAHKEITPDQSREILKSALYSPTLIGQTQPINRPNYWVAIETADKNSVVVIEVSSSKDNVEIVGWRLVDARGLEKMKRQAEREGGQFLIQTSDNDAAAALSALPLDPSSPHKDSEPSNDTQQSAPEVLSPLEKELDDLLDGSLSAEEIAAYVSEKRKVAAKEYERTSKLSPKMGTNKAKYLAEKKSVQEKQEAAKKEVDLWNAIARELEGMSEQADQDKVSKSINDAGNLQPRSKHEVSAQFLSGIKLTRQSYRKELGYGNEEAKRMVGLFASEQNGGVTLEHAAELLKLYDSENGYNTMTGIDDSDARNLLIEVLGEVRTRGDLYAYARKNRAEEARQEESSQMEQAEQICQEMYNMSIDEYEAYIQATEVEIRKSWLNDEQLSEYNGILADEYNNRYNGQENNKQGGASSLRTGSDGVLPGEQSTQTGGSAGVGEQAAPDSNRADGATQEGKGKEVTSLLRGQQRSATKDGFVPPEPKPGESSLKYAERIVEARKLYDAEQAVNTTPTEAQKEAGNYRKGHVKVSGFDVTIEQPAGSIRSGKDASGKAWSVTMNNTYGYIRGTMGVDGDHIDVFLNTTPESDTVFVVDQVNTDGTFDEHKVMMGFNSLEEAKAAYLSNYSDGWTGLGTITPVSMEAFTEWIDSSTRKTKAFAEYKIAKEKEAKYAERGSAETVELSMDTEEDGLRFRDGSFSLPIGERIAGYRYGEAPESGRSFNTSTNEYEAGVSMAQVGNMDEVSSFAVDASSNRNKYYYEGVVAGTGGDGEVCLLDVKRITRKEYLTSKGTFKDTNNAIVNFICDRKASFINAGWHTYPSTIEAVEDLRNRQLIGDSENGEMYRTSEEPPNTRFNRELSQQIAGTLPKGHVYQLGYPSDVLLSAGVPDLPIELSAERLALKASEEYESNHPFRLESIENLPEAIQNPIAVFDSTQRNGSKVVLLELREGNDNFVVAVQVRGRKDGRKSRIEVNDVRSIYPKDQKKSILNWINGGLLRWVDKGKASHFLSTQWPNYIGGGNNNGGSYSSNRITQQLPNATDLEIRVQDFKTATKIVDSFENPTIPVSENASEAENSSISSAATTLSEALHTPVRLVEDVTEITDTDRSLQRRKRGSKGWYDTNTGEVVIVLPNATDVSDVQATILHEVVAHKGLRKLLGEDFTPTMEAVYNSLPEEVQASLAKEFGKNHTKAAEEYCAHLAETMSDPSLIERICAVLRNALRKIGISVKMNDGDVMYMLWKSRNRLLDSDTSFDVMSKIAQGERVKRETEEYDTLFRDPKPLDRLNLPLGMRSYYEGQIQSKTELLHEAYVDGLISVRKLQTDVEEKLGESLPDHKNVYMYANTLSSRNTYDQQMFKQHLSDPMVAAMKQLRDKGMKEHDLENYVMAKHGLERNDYMRLKALTDYINELEDDVLRDILTHEIKDKPFAKITPFTNEEAEAMRAKLAERDYSGLTAIQKEMKDVPVEFFIESTEAAHPAEVAHLWDTIRAVNNYSIKKWFDSGMINRTTYEGIKGMYQYYVPLRGFDEAVAHDVFQYYIENDSDSFSSPLKKAKGRKSRPDSPFPHMMSIANSAIVSGNKNQMKLYLYRLAQTKEVEGMSINKQWYVRTGVEDGVEKWKESFPTFDADPDLHLRNIEAHDAEMIRLKAQGDAKIKKGRLNIGLRASKEEERQHTVRVNLNGEEHLILVHGNPKIAQAINGQADETRTDNKIVKGIEYVNRQMAANFTTRNPAFVMTNLSRDLIWSTTTLSVKEGSTYRNRFLRNIPKASKALARRIKEGDKWVPQTDVDHLLDEFLRNGARTGYTAMYSIDKYKQQIKDSISTGKWAKTKRGYNAVLDFMQLPNEWAEDLSRFATYITSRQVERSILQSAYDAKEVTVNFNRKGSGAMGAGVFRAFYLFFNAAVQGLNQVTRMAKAHPWKMAGALGGFGMIGFVMPLIISMFGDDEDREAYDNLPDYTRRNNLCIPLRFMGMDGYLKVPLPIELRAMYAIGDAAYRGVCGLDEGSTVATDVILGLTDLLPLNPVGGASNFVPDAFAPVYESYFANKDFTGRPIARVTPFNEFDPEYQRVYRNTSVLPIKVSEYLNILTGGDAARRGWYDNLLGKASGEVNLSNPAAMEHLFEAYLGGTFTFLNQSFKTAIGAPTGMNDFAWRTTPVFNRFIEAGGADASVGKVNERYFTYKKEMEELQTIHRKYEQLIDTSPSWKMKEYYAKQKELEDSPEWRRIETIQFYVEEVQDVQNELKETTDDAERKKLEQEMNQRKRELVERMRE